MGNGNGKSLEAWIWDAACSIRGAKDAAKFKDFILPLIFTKRLCDVFDDELNRIAEEVGSRAKAFKLVRHDKKLVRFYLPLEPKNADDAVWSVIRTLSDKIGEELTTQLRAIADANPLLKGIIDRVDFNATTHGQRDIDDDRLSNLIEAISAKRLGLKDVEADIIGRSYEYLIRKFAEGSGQSAGEFYTPAEVGLVMARIMDPEPGMEIYDPCCGSAGLLIKCRLVLDEKLKGSKKKDAAPLRLYGQESEAGTWAMANMNMIIHDMEGEIQIGDTFRNPKFRAGNGLKTFDGLIEVEGDTATLHPSAIELFQASEDGFPRITEIEAWVEHIWFDLVSRNLMTPDRTRTTKNLAEIRPDNVAREMPAAFAQSAFESNFTEYLRSVRRIPDPERLGLYSISAVEAGRFGYVVVKGREDLLLEPEAKIVPHLLEVEISNVARFRPLSDALWDSYRSFTGPTPSAAAISDFARLTGDESVGHGHSDQGFFDIAHWIDSQGGTGDQNRHPVVGATYIERNLEFFIKMLEDRALTPLKADKPRDLELLWFRPAGTGWGASPDLHTALSSIKGGVRRTLSRFWRVRTVLVVPQVSRTENNRRFEALFDRACVASAGYLSPAVEILLLRRIGAVVTVCVRVSDAIFIPVGFSVLGEAAITTLEKSLRLEAVESFHELWRHPVEDDDEAAAAAAEA